MAADGAADIYIMMNGLPGNMGKEVAAACLRKGFSMAPYALTGADVTATEVDVDDMQGGPSSTVQLLKAGQADLDEKITAMKKQCGEGLICIDYTHPSAVNGNAELYARHKLNFVMGTTGGDRQKLLADTEQGGAYAVIAPNMGKQIVALQTAIDYMAKEFGGAFSGYSLSITESHQSTKADTSGTAKALAEDFSALTGAPFDVENDIKMIRDAEGQKAFGVPEEHLRGHAFHTYSLQSDDGTVEFQFRHNVCGRRMYADGTADAVEFLAKQIRAKADRKLYNMIDVLKMGGI